MKLKQFLGGALAALMVVSGLPVSGMTGVLAANGGAVTAENGISVWMEDVQESENYTQTTGAYTLSEEEKTALSSLNYADGDAMMISILFKQNESTSTVQPMAAVTSVQDTATQNFNTWYASNNNMVAGGGGRVEHQPTAMKFTSSLLKSQAGEWSKLSIIVPRTGTIYYYLNGQDPVTWESHVQYYPALTTVMAGNAVISQIYLGHCPNNLNTSYSSGEIRSVEIKKLENSEYASQDGRLAAHSHMIGNDKIKQEKTDYLAEKNAEIEKLTESDYTVASWSGLTDAIEIVEATDKDWEILNIIEEDPIQAAIDALQKFSAEVQYVTGCSEEMGEIGVTTNQNEGTAEFTASPAEFYKFDGWYAEEAGTTQKSSDSHYTYTREGSEESIILYAKFVLDIDTIDALIAQAKETQQSEGYAESYTEETRSALSDALTALETDRTAEKAAALKTALAALETSGEVRYGEIGSQVITEEKDQNVFDHIQNMTVDVVYKMKEMANADVAFGTFVGNDGQFLTLLHHPQDGRAGFSISSAGFTTDAFWSGGGSDVTGSWEKVTFHFAKKSDGSGKLTFAMARNGAYARSGMPYDLNEDQKQAVLAFFGEREISSFLVGQKLESYVPQNQTVRDMRNMDPENVELKYVKVRSSANPDARVNNQEIDQEVEEEYTTLLEECDAKNPADYTKASWDAFQAVLTANRAGEDSSWTKSDWAMLDAIDAITAASENLRAYKQADETTVLNIGTELKSRKGGDLFPGEQPEGNPGDFIQVKVNPDAEEKEILPEDMEISWNVTENSRGITVQAIENYPSKASLTVTPGAKGTIQANVKTTNGAGTAQTKTVECEVTVGYEVVTDYVTDSDVTMGSTDVRGTFSNIQEAPEVEEFLQGELYLPGDSVTLTPQVNDGYVFKGWYKDKEGTDPYEEQSVEEFTYSVSDSDSQADENGRITFYAKFEKVPLNYEKLDEQIKIAENLKKEDYTSGWEAFQQAFNDAKALKESQEAVTQKEIDEKADALKTAIGNLVIYVEEPELPKEYQVKIRTEKQGEEAQETVAASGKYNTKVELHESAYREKAGAAADAEFVGWKEGDKIISTLADYTFYIADDITLMPVYATPDEPQKVEAQALMSNVIVTQGTDDKVNVKFVGQLVLPEGCKLKQAGLIWGVNKNADDLEVDESKRTVKNASVTAVKTVNKSYQYSVTLNGLAKGKFLSAKVYMYYQDADGNYKWAFSDVTKVINSDGNTNGVSLVNLGK